MSGRSSRSLPAPSPRSQWRSMSIAAALPRVNRHVFELRLRPQLEVCRWNEQRRPTIERLVKFGIARLEFCLSGERKNDPTASNFEFSKGRGAIAANSKI